MKKRILLGCMALLFLTACAQGEKNKESTQKASEVGNIEKTQYMEVQFHDVSFQLPKEYEMEIISREWIQLAKTQNSSITLRYEYNQEKNRTKEYALGEYAATKMLEIAGKYPEAVFVESCIVDTDYGYYLKLSYEITREEKQVAYQVFYPMMESYDFVIECFDAKDYEGTSFLETAECIAKELVVEESEPKEEPETEVQVTLATEVEMQN